MNYRGFRIECYSPDAPADRAARVATPAAAFYVEYKVLESQPDSKWREIGVANDLEIAREMIDRLIQARQRFLKVVGYSTGFVRPH